MRLRGSGRASGTGPGGQGGGGGGGGRAVRALRGAGAAGGRHAAARARAAPLRRLAVACCPPLGRPSAAVTRTAGNSTAPHRRAAPDYREDDIICNTGVAL